jgi:CelD/BcsL family acetyltransferase involved in cellulose biosynthesis/GNAT superfamily N-acetyltransferase
LIQVKRLEMISDISSESWDNLVLTSEINSVFLTYEWIKCWWDTYHEDRTLLLLIAEDSNQLVGIAPLMISNSREGTLKTKLVQFASMGETDYCDFICSKENKPAVITAFMDYLKTDQSLWQKIALDNIPEESSTPVILREYLQKSDYKFMESVSQECYAMAFKGEEKFVHSVLMRNGVKGRYNFLKNHGKIEYRKAESTDEIVKELPAFFEFHKDRRLLMGDKSKFHEEKARQFFVSLSDCMMKKGWLRFDIVRYNDVPIVYHFGFVYNNRHHHYTQTFNMDYYRRSPGMVMMKCVIEDCLEHQYDELDLARGSEEYKKWFANVIRKNMRFEIYSDNIRYSIAQKKLSAKESVKTKSPKIYGILKNFLDPSTYKLFFNALNHTVRKNGLGNVTLAVLNRIRMFIFFPLKIIVFRMILSERDVNWTHGEFTIREGNYSDLKVIASEYSEMVRVRVLRLWFDRLKEGQKLYIVEKDNRIVHYSWSTVSKEILIQEMDYMYKLPREMWYLYHAYTYPKYRGLGIYTAVLRYVADRAFESGAQELCGYVLASNFAPQKGIKKTGALPMIAISMIKILFFKNLRFVEYDNEFREKLGVGS